MDLLIAFMVFTGSMVTCLFLNYSLCYALLIGLICFFITGLFRGYKAIDLFKSAAKGARTSLVVIKFLFFIGCLTALWRASGTIAFFVYYGIKLVTPHLFIFITFLLTMILSFVLGTSFGVVGTAGIMLMILARSGGVNQLITAGAIISGAYFGDRCSPASSAALLAASVSGVKPEDNMKMMLKTSVIPVALTFIVYLILSVKNPIGRLNAEVLTLLKSSFDLSWIVILPAAVLLILPWLKVSVFITIIASSITAFIIAAGFQPGTIVNTFKVCILGYAAPSKALGSILSGGGIVSMIEVMVIVLLSSAYSGIFQGTGMLDHVQQKIGTIADKIGLFPTQIMVSIFSAGVFCNQTIGTILAAQLFGGVYDKKGASQDELATDIGSSILTIAGLIPWSIAASVPLAILSVSPQALLYSVLLYAIPLCYLFTKNIWYKPIDRFKNEGVRGA